MLGLILIYFIWKYYSELAIEHGKSKWGFGILGIICYYGGAFIAGIVIGIIMAYRGTSVEDTNDFVLGLIALPFGLLATWGVYKMLQKNWSKESKPLESDSLDSDLLK